MHRFPSFFSVKSFAGTNIRTIKHKDYQTHAPPPKCEACRFPRTDFLACLPPEAAGSGEPAAMRLMSAAGPVCEPGRRFSFLVAGGGGAAQGVRNENPNIDFATLSAFRPGFLFTL